LGIAAFSGTKVRIIIVLYAEKIRHRHTGSKEIPGTPVFWLPDGQWRPERDGLQERNEE
jgi:hypothetical protein